MKISRIANFINNSKTAQKVLKSIDRNPAIYGAASSFVLAAVLRPSLIGCFNFKDEKDKKYSQASAIAAGSIELLSSIALFLPLNKSIENASKKLYDCKNTIFYQNAQRLRQYKSITNRGIKVLSLIPISLARFALVKPIVDTLFKDKNQNA